jgi:adenylylsulfate kinase
MIYWFTGQPGHGKTVLADLLKTRLEEKFGKSRKIFHIDGDDLRDLTSNKDYSRKGREMNIQRAQTIAQYLHNQGHDVIVSLVSPYLEIREEFKTRVGDIIEFYVHTEEIRGREEFHSLDYEKPSENFVDIDTTGTLPEDSLEKIISHVLLDTEEKWESNIHVGSSLPPKEGQFAMFVGRWQPLHNGHQSLFKQAMEEGKNVLICIRDIKPDDKNPFSPNEVLENISSHYQNEISEGKVRVMIVPDICSVEFGRGVGYDIIERIPPLPIGRISATKVREQLKMEGKI